MFFYHQPNLNKDFDMRWNVDRLRCIFLRNLLFNNSKYEKFSKDNK